MSASSKVGFFFLLELIILKGGVYYLKTRVFKIFILDINQIIKWIKC